MVTTDDLAKLLLRYAAQYSDADDLLTPATTGSGVVYPDHQTRSVNVYIENVGAAQGGQDVPPLSGAGPPGYDMYYSPPVAYLWWVNNGKLLRRDEVRFTEQAFLVPMWSKENLLIWETVGLVRIGIWRYYDSAAAFPF